MDNMRIAVACRNASSMADRPLGEGGQLVRCWAHVQTADADPGLTKARG